MNTRVILLLLSTAATTGCSTYSSLVDRKSGDPLVMSGTRLNLSSMAAHSTQNGSELAKNPLIDLPFSLLGDVILLGITLPSALAAKVVE